MDTNGHTILFEDYVSFKTAVLLKEKGFDVPCDSYYTYFESNVTLYKGYLHEFSDSNINHNKHNDRTSRPSQSLALKWLREVHKIFIEINVSIDINGDYHYNYSILDKECKYIKRFIDYYSSHESCVEAALLFVLKNLI